MLHIYPLDDRILDQRLLPRRILGGRRYPYDVSNGAFRGDFGKIAIGIVDDDDVVFSCGANEIDFIALENATPTYYQVALTVRDEATLARELKPLKLIRDNHPKFLLTLDRDPRADFDGIKQINAIDFLLDPNGSKYI